MVTKRIILIGLSIASMLPSRVNAQDYIQKHQVYDTITHTFNDSRGGVDEKILQSIDTIVSFQELDRKFKDANILQSIQLYDEKERDIKFGYISERIFRQKVSLRRAIKSNFNILKELDKKDITDLKQDEIAIKLLMNELGDIKKYYETNNIKNKKLLALEMYNVINNKKLDYEVEVKWTKNIKYVMNEDEGDCTEYTAVNYALLNFYGIDTYFKIGKTFKNDSVTGGHAWIHVKTDSESFDMDPKNVKMAVPLEERNPQEIKPQQYIKVHKHYDSKKRK